ncbi:phage tail spike protein [Lacticaseibacillus absianus]|uniref:phage tail spike protein n=1 Tax=Lacticaseibacillus absianus TaxID=2729623 RepID=UPI0015CAD596|nr:phage tail spike protein [Lacticaseibacillus absianus]
MVLVDFYFTDRKYNLIGIASAGGSGPIQLTGEIDKQQVPDSVARTLIGTLTTDPSNASRLEEMAAFGNFVLYQDASGRSVFMTVMEWPDTGSDPQSGSLVFLAINGGIDLINETIGSYTATKAMSIAEYINLFAADSGFEIGVNELAGQARTLKWESEEETVLTRVESVATQFDAELDFRFEITGTQVIKHYIDIYHHIGADKNQRLEVNTHLNSIKTTGNIYDLCTSINPTGGMPEGKDSPINLKGYTWTDPDGRFVLGADGILRDTVAVQLWSRALSNENPNPTDHHIQRVKTYEAVTQATLLQSALADLKQYNHAAVNYEVDLVDLPDSVMVGDTVHLVDEEQELNLSARLLQLETSYSEGTRTATFGDYLIEASQIDPALQDLADQIKRIPKTVQYYPWVRYADDDQGTDLSALPAGKAYMAVVYGDTSVPSDDAADYAGKWQKVVGPAGKDGNDGEPGEGGKDGRTPYFHKAYANSMDGLDFSTTDATGKSYLGTYSDFTQVDSADPASYKWQLVKGDRGEPGPAGEDGENGAPGIPGVDGRTPYIHTAWATSADGSENFSTSRDNRVDYFDLAKWMAGAKAANSQIAADIALKPNTTYTVSTDYPDPTTSYYDIWTDKKGVALSSSTNPLSKSHPRTITTGADGLVTLAVRDGAPTDAITMGKNYIQIEDGSHAGSRIRSVEYTYWGTYTDFEQVDSTDPAKYVWTLIKGADGEPGKDGADGENGKDGKDGAENVPVTTIGSAYPASPKSGDIHWLTNAKGVVTGYYLYSGTTWTAKPVDASTIAAETFVGKTFQGMHFIGSDFTNSYTLVPEDVGAEGNPAYIYHSGTLAMKNGKLEAHDSIYKADKTTLVNQIAMAYDPTQGLMMQTFDATGKKEQYYMAMSPAAGSMVMRTPDHIGSLDAGYLEQLNGAGKLLWSGGYYMTGTQSVTPSVPLNKCLNGWVLLWSYYNSGAQADSDWNTTIINKNWAAVHSGTGIVTPLSTASGSVRTQKYLFVTNATLKGYTSGSGGNGSGDAAKFVLREVYAF